MHSRNRDLDSLIDALERAALHGHGGAYFPTATKLRAVGAQGGRRRPVVVVNGSEGEPLSRKDRFLLGSRTEVVLHGALAVARALGADTVVIAVDHRRTRTLEVLDGVLRARPELLRDQAPVVEVVPVPAGFVTGQETALVNFLNGRDATPTTTPPYPFEKGVLGRPTLVSNAETFFQIARVLAGERDASRFVTVSGAVAQTSVVQVSPSTTVRAALAAAGGLTEDVRAVLLGGYGGTWAPVPAALDLVLDEPSLRAEGLTLGAGIVHALGVSRCGVAEVAAVTRWMAGESAGQCGPCVFGLDAIAAALEELCGGHPVAGSGGGPQTLARIRRWCEMVNRRGACAHPDGVARYVTSALAVMSADFIDHATHGPCEVCAPTWRSAKVPSLRPASETRRRAADPGRRGSGSGRRASGSEVHADQPVAV